MARLRNTQAVKSVRALYSPKRLTVPETPEQNACIQIDSLLGLAGWSVQDVKDANIHASRGVALREFPLNSGFGFVD